MKATSLIVKNRENTLDYMDKVSVIIPVYNAGKYLKKCISSISRQTYSELEIIAVEDCGTDNSLELLK